MADPFLDAIGVKDPTAASAPARAAGPAPTYDPTDLAVRLAMLEDAQSPEGQAAVAGVMANRAKAAKGDLLSVLTAPKAFEPWATSQDKIAAIDPNSDAYKAAAARVLPVLQGKVANPVGEAINFYSPESQAALAGDGQHPAKPGFDDGTGVRIGGNLFFGTGQPATPGGADPFLSAIGVGPAKAAAAPAGGPADESGQAPTIKVVNGKVVFGDTGQPVPEAQVQVLRSLIASGRMNGEGKIDGVQVHMQRDPSDTIAKGDFYISAPSKEGAPALAGGPQGNSVGGGAAQGVEDVALSLAQGLQHLPGASDSGAVNFLQSQQQIYDATHPHGVTASGIGRFLGQAGASAPLLSTVEIPAAAVAAKTGLPSAAEFLAGKGMSPALARLLGGAGTMAAKGAAEGAGAAALTSSASDEPLSEQIGAGALGGALLAPAAGAVGAGFKKLGEGVRGLIEPHTANGPANIAERRIAEVLGLGPSQPADLTEHVPGSTPTLAEATGSAPLAQMQRNLSQNPITAGVFQAADDANNAARQAVTHGAQGDPATVADLARDRAAVVDAHKAAIFGGAGEANSQPVVEAIDAALQTPEAHTPEVNGALQKARSALVTEPEKDLTPAESDAFHQQILGTAGGNGTALTPEAMSAAKEKLGAKFEDIAGRTNVIVDPELDNGLKSVVHDAGQVIEESKVKPLQNLVDQIGSTVQDGQISGASYKALIRRNGPLDLLMRSPDGAVRYYAGQIREHLDDALERTMASDFPGDRIPQPAKPYDPNAAQAAAETAGKAAPAPAEAPQMDDTDRALNLLRARKEGGGGKGPSLADALIKQGGVQDAGGGLADLGAADYGKKGGLLNRKSGMDLERATEWAADNGFIPRTEEADGSYDASKHTEEFLTALRQDLDGKTRVYSQGPTASDAVKAHADDLEEMLGEMGVDPASMPNGRIKQKMAEYFGTSTADTGATKAAPAASGPAPAVNEADAAANAARAKAALDELRTTRLQYKNLKTLEAAVRTAGPDGKVTPRAVYNAVKQNFGQFAYKGGGPLGDAAEAALTAQDAKAPTFEKRADQVFALRENLTSNIDKLTKAGETDDAARAAAARLTQVRDAMDKALGESVPGYDRYRHIADSTAEPIEAQRYLQSMPLTTNGRAGGTVTLNLVNKALERIDKGRSMPGPHPAKAITQATLDQLRALQADLERQENRNLGKAKGSETNQLGSAQVEFGAMGAPLLAVQHVAGKVPLIGPHVAAAVGNAGRAGNERVMGALATRLLNPEPIVQQGVRIPSRARQIGAGLANTLPGAAGGLLSARLLGGQ